MASGESRRLTKFDIVDRLLEDRLITKEEATILLALEKEIPKATESELTNSGKPIVQVFAVNNLLKPNSEK